MNHSEGKGLTDKARDAADKIDDKIEPNESEDSTGPAANHGASDPLINDQRPDET